MNKVNFINDLGLSYLNSKITVNVVINNGDRFIKKSINTSKCKLIHAINSKTRFSFANMINHLDGKNELKAIAYRAFTSYKKDMAILEKNCVQLGITN